MKRSYSGRRYQDFPSVSVEYPSSSCSGPPPRLFLKDMWPQNRGARSRSPNAEPAQERLRTDGARDSSQRRLWTLAAGGDEDRRRRRTFGGPSSEPEQTWNFGGNVFCGPGRANVGGVRNKAELSVLQPGEEEDEKPPVLFSKREPRIYAPGSQEERWQLQIAARGRAKCPKCKSVSRKTVEGLKKHVDKCRTQAFTCQHCGKQLKSSTGMKYHVMADHGDRPSAEDAQQLDQRAVKDKLRKILKQLGKVKCCKEGCTAAFSSIMGYMYHMKKCGKDQAELDKMLLACPHCGKAYKSKTGLDYHLKSEHAPAGPAYRDEVADVPSRAEAERSSGGRVRRASALLANFHMAEMAKKEPSKDWPKRNFQSDLVPDDKKLKYSRPGLPAFSQDLLRKWKNEVKLHRKVHCPNQGCGCTYTSVSGLKAHLGLCTRGDFEAGKYRCLICGKEFHSESGVKYHINATHSQEWFVTNKKASVRFLKKQPRETDHYHHHHHHRDSQMQRAPPLLCTPVARPPGPTWPDATSEQAPIEMDDADKMAEGNRRERQARRDGGLEQRGQRGPAARWDRRRQDGWEFHARASKRQKLL